MIGWTFSKNLMETRFLWKSIKVNIGRFKLERLKQKLFRQNCFDENMWKVICNLFLHPWMLSYMEFPSNHSFIDLSNSYRAVVRRENITIKFPIVFLIGNSSVRRWEAFLWRGTWNIKTSLIETYFRKIIMQTFSAW